MYFIFLSFLSIVTALDLKTLSLEFENDQRYVRLDAPKIYMYQGTHSECFERIHYQQTGYFLASSDASGSLEGLLSIPILRDAVSEKFLNIYWDFTTDTADTSKPRMYLEITGTNGASFNRSSLNQTLFVNADFTWSEIELPDGLFAALYMNSRNTKLVKIRFYWEQRLVSGNYKILALLNLYAVGNWYTGATLANGTADGTSRELRLLPYDASMTDAKNTDKWQLFNISRVFDNVYLISPQDVSFKALNYQIGADVIGNLGGAFNHAHFPSLDPRQLWEISMDYWQRWTIKLYGADIYWSNDNNSTILQKVALRPQSTIDLSQEFLIIPVSS